MVQLHGSPDKLHATYFSYQHYGVCDIDGNTEQVPFVIQDGWNPEY